MVSIKEEEEDEDQETPNQQPEEDSDHHTPQMESESSPLRSPIPTNPPQLHPKPPPEREPPLLHENLSQIIAKDRRIRGFSPLRSPEPQQAHPLSPVIVVNRSIREELNVAAATKVDPPANRNSFPRVSTAPPPPLPPPAAGGRRSRAVSSNRKDGVMKRAGLGFRLCAAVFCLISFSVMAADKTQGWAGDSFDRYKEYRYCLSMTVIGFVYAGFQAVDLACHLTAGRHVIQNDIRYYFDFFMDQILTYLLISASSAGASRVDDWQSNWGKDEFTVMASASIGMSFLAFVAFAFSSLISGYNLCMHFQT